MRKLWLMALIGLGLLALAGCANDDAASTPDFSGPALVMFYSDN